MKLIVVYRQPISSARQIDCYPKLFAEELELRGHDVLRVGDGNPISTLEYVDVNGFDFLIELENGRNRQGDLEFEHAKFKKRIPSAVWFIDSHGHSSLHKRAAKKYDHVFFAVYSKRDLFIKHRSSHWCPNSTSLRFFGCSNFRCTTEYDFGFFGSKGGLGRADPLGTLAAANKWSVDIRQVGKAHRHKWPRTGEAMSKCNILFNHGQKHDGPNQRVMESMIMKKPLLTDIDPMDGMSKLFVDGYHFIGYESYTYANLEEKMRWCLDNPKEAAKIAKQGYNEVKSKHLIGNRVNQILEVIS